VSADERPGDAGEHETLEEQIATLSTERRCTALEMITQALVAACPASTVRPLGSLATGTADSYSDIDLAWVVPDDVFASCIAQAPDALAHAAPIRRVRMDPDFQLSRKRRLLFVRYVHLPLFWRIDLDIRARSIAACDDYDLNNPEARGTDWSLPASALENAVAAIKALRREQPDIARGLLMRGYARVGHSYEPREWSTDIVRLAELCLVAEGDLQPLHQEVVALASSVRAR
jgi:predicted nucleotidyltransferase